jgi:putative tricarboxylic transport membrane protein
VGEIVLSAAVAVLGAATFLLARTFPSGKTLEMQPGFYPQVLGVLLVLLAGLQLFQTLTRTRAAGWRRTFKFALPRSFKPLLVLGLMAGYWMLLFFTGFVVSTVIALLAMVKIFGGSWRQALLTCLVGPPLFYVVFQLLFEVPLPRGLLGLL